MPATIINATVAIAASVISTLPAFDVVDQIVLNDCVNSMILHFLNFFGLIAYANIK